MNATAANPLYLKHEVEIFAPPQIVWTWLSRIELWADWHPDISGTRWLEDRGANATFKWRIKKLLGLPARIDSWRERREIAFTAKAWLTTARHRFRIDGDFRRTRVVCEAFAEGGAASSLLLQPLLERQMDRVNQTWLGVLKARLEAEQPGPNSGRGAGPPPRSSPRRSGIGGFRF